MENKILVIDDEPDIVDLLSYNLKKEGFRVTSASDGEEALQELRMNKIDFVLLDLMLPTIQGEELCRIMKNDPRTADIPIIMLTAKGGELDRVLGLESGADDYMTKPFSVRELIARIRAVLRRAGETTTQKIIRIGKLNLNMETYCVSKGTTQLDLSATEFKLFLYLVQRKGKVFNREQLVEAVWKQEAFIEPRTVDVHIRRLRTQLEDDPANPLYIKTRRGVGYYVDADL